MKVWISLNNHFRSISTKIQEESETKITKKNQLFIVFINKDFIIQKATTLSPHDLNVGGQTAEFIYMTLLV